MWEEPEPNPSRSGRGYCGYCRILYSDLQQHVSSLRHLDSVHLSSPGAGPSLLERFLGDVQQHHPHRYQDSRPSYDDLPSGPLRPTDVPRTFSQSGEALTEGVGQEPAPIRGHQGQESTRSQSLPPGRRKAHRKTNQRKKSSSSPSPVCPDPGPGLGPCPLIDLRPWLGQQQDIQLRCHGDSETVSFHISLPASVETAEEPWDIPVQLTSQKGCNVTCLMDVKVDLDPMYAAQLDSALHGEQRVDGGATADQGVLCHPVRDVRPEHALTTFRGKTWTQIVQDDEEKVVELVRQFRQGTFVCYFDSESLARYGRRRRGQKEGAEPASNLLPLMDHEEDKAECDRRRGRGLRLAARCQVVKVSRSTQTLRPLVPAVRPSLAPPTGIPPVDRSAEQTPTCCLPPFHKEIITLLHPRNSLLYLLCSPDNPAPTAGSALQRCRKKRRVLDLQGAKVKYKRLPVRFYDVSSGRVLMTPPRGFLRCGSSTCRRLSPPYSATYRRSPACRRQLFRSLSPDLNTENEVQGSEVKGQRLADTTSCFKSSCLPSTSVTTQGRSSGAPPPESSTHQRRVKARTRVSTKDGPYQIGTTPLPPTETHLRRGRARRGRGCTRR